MNTVLVSSGIVTSTMQRFQQPISSTVRCNNSRLQAIYRSSLSSSSSRSESTAAASKEKFVKQDFVKVEFEPGEWNENQSDPLYKPPWKNKARILSIDEMNNRPVVFLKDRPPSLRESGFLPTWLFERQREAIYQMYLDMMTELSKTGSGTTSHEYVTYVIGQKFNISKERAAAVIQLRHNEEQLKKEGMEMHTDVQKVMDEAMQKLMMTAYQSMGYRHPPDSYIEDPSPHPKEGNRNAMAVNDLFDEDQAEADAVSREKAKAHLILNNKRFIEDIHPSKRTVKLDQNTRHFLKQKESFPGDVTKYNKHKQKSKFLCKFIDTAQEKKQRKAKNKKNKSQINNIVIEDNATGKVRAATMEEINHSSYKPNRYALEFIYGDAKKGWLNKTIHDKDTWGKAQELVADVAAVQDKI